MLRLYCFGQSGNSYKIALMLTLCDVAWEPVPVDFFRGETRSDKYRATVNAMGEAPVLDYGGEKLSQSGVILHRLAEETGRFAPLSAADREECWRWVLFDNQKFTANLATYRFLRCFAPKPVDPAVLAFMKGRVSAAYKIAEQHFERHAFVLGDHPTIADISMCGYVFYPDSETGLDLATEFPAIDRWRERLRALPGWRGPYDLMPMAALT